MPWEIAPVNPSDATAQPTTTALIAGWQSAISDPSTRHFARLSRCGLPRDKGKGGAAEVEGNGAAPLVEVGLFAGFLSAPIGDKYSGS
jgi:hypothetical protein